MAQEHGAALHRTAELPHADGASEPSSQCMLKEKSTFSNWFKVSNRSFF